MDLTQFFKRVPRVRGMRRLIQDADGYWRVDSFLRAAIARDLSALLHLEKDSPVELPD